MGEQGLEQPVWVSEAGGGVTDLCGCAPVHERERERQRERQRQRETDRQTDRQTDRDRETQRERENETV